MVAAERTPPARLACISIAPDSRAACIIGFMRSLAPVFLALAVSTCSSSSKVVDPVVAQVGKVTITVGELQTRLPKLAQSFRAQFATSSSAIDKRVFLLNVMLKDEAVVQEARRRGYDRDPAVRSVTIDRMLEDEVEASNKPVDLPNSDVERYYLDHKDELTWPEQVRVLQMVAHDRAVAQRVAAQARAAEKSDIDAFQSLVVKHSEDWLSRARGGDMGFIDRKSSRFPVAVVDAAFALRGLYDVSDPIESEHGFHVLKLVQRLPAFTPTLAEAAPDIRAKLRRLLVERKKSALARILLERAGADIDYAVLVKVPLPKF
jgi:parvulin-like peptidyl-prolyl isomerase